MISYNSLSGYLPSIDQRTTTAWIKRVVEHHGFTIGTINYVFCNDEEILAINQQYLQHDYYTDIITFDYSTEQVLSGDLYISLDTVASNALLFAKDEQEELHRVLIHGVLHLMGINDKGPGERAIMEAHENKALNLR